MKKILAVLIFTLFSCTIEENKYDFFETSLNKNADEVSIKSKFLLSSKSSPIEVFLIDDSDVKPKYPKENPSIGLNSNQNNSTVSLDPLSNYEPTKTYSQYQEGVFIVSLDPLSNYEPIKTYSQYQEGVLIISLDSVTPPPPPIIPDPILEELITEEIPTEEPSTEDPPIEELPIKEPIVESDPITEEPTIEEPIVEPDPPIEKPVPVDPPVEPDPPIEPDPPVVPPLTESEFIKLSENWAPGEPTGNQPYTFMVSDTGKWIDHHSTLNFDGYGLYQIKKSISLINQDLYPDFNDFFFLGELRGVTYFFSKNIMAADVYLNSRPLNGEATPVILDSREKIDYIVSFYDQYSIRAFWIGLRKIGSEWEWIKD